MHKQIGLDTLEELRSEVDQFIFKVAHASGGLVVIRQDSSIIVWMAIPEILHDSNYAPGEFCEDISSRAGTEIYHGAFLLAKKILDKAQARFGRVSIGKFVAIDQFQRMEFGAFTYRTAGVIHPNGQIEIVR